MHLSIRSVVGFEVARDFSNRVNYASAMLRDHKLVERFWDRVDAGISENLEPTAMWAALYRIWQDECRGIAWPSEFPQISS